MQVPKLDPATERRVQDHARTVGVSADFVLNHIVNKWMDETGDYLAQRITNKRAREKNERRATKATKAARIRPHMVPISTPPAIHAGL